LVTLDTVKAFARTTQTTEDIPATNDDTDLHTALVGFLDLKCILVQTLYVDTVALFAHQAFATQFQKDSIKFIHSIKDLNDST
jgi:hypothetical protein